MKEFQNNISFIQPRDAWDRLSMKEKAAMIKVAVKNDITNLKDIRKAYNEFAEGGSVVDDELYGRVRQEEGNLPAPTDIGDGKTTIGSGLTAQKWHDLYKKRGNKWSETDNRMAVREELIDRENWARNNVPNWERLPDSSKRALLLYKYNYDFTRNNSPKLFRALEEFNLPEAARQMDATSKNPKFKKGLMNRRLREQNLFLSEVNMPKGNVSMTPIVEQTVSTSFVNPFADYVQPVPTVMVPERDSYVAAHKLTPEEERRNKVQERWDAIQNFNKLMNLIGIKNNPLQQFVPNSPFTGLIGNNIGSANNRKRKHRERGNLFYPGGELTPEEEAFSSFVVKASEDPMVDIAKQNPGYSSTLSKIYENDDFTKEQASRLLEVYNYAGRPYLLTLPKGSTRAYTNREMLAPWQKPVIYLNADEEQGFTDLTAELSHPLQFKYGNNSNYVEHINPFYDSDDYRDKTRYDYPNKYESETHLDFQPLVKDYILKGILPGQIYYTNNTEGFLGNSDIVENPTFEQVMDSARAYNQRKQDMDYQYKFNRYKRKPRNKYESFFGDLF